MPFFILTLFYSQISCTGKVYQSVPNFTKTDLKNSITDATSFLVQSIDANGKFTYRVNTNPKVKVTEGYNILRHAGAIYSLGMSYQVNRYYRPRYYRYYQRRSRRYHRGEILLRTECKITHRLKTAVYLDRENR